MPTITQERTQTNENAPLVNVVQETTNYDQFNFLAANREVNKRHVQTIKASFEDNGNFTKAQPILVNEQYEVIDGQHRLVAAKEMGLPIYYTIVPGLNADTARRMNLLHRKWIPLDYLRTYTSSGKRPYILFQQLLEEFPGVSISVVMEYANGVYSNGLQKAFRNGELRLNQEMLARARRNLTRLQELTEINKSFRTRPMAQALLVAINSDGYRHRKMLEKVEARGADLQPYQNVKDNVRQLEDVYNFRVTQANHVRFF